LWANQKRIAKLFAQARNAASCILLLDQFESIMAKRGTSSSSEGSGDRIVTSFLTEMDGIFTKGHSGSSIFIVAITSNILSIDEAVLRPGRLDIHVRVPFPDSNSRLEILNGILSGMPHALSS
jgi:transitional endoplasmic reticulum ATPase